MTPFDRWLTNEPELPENCPQCEEPNYNDDGDWITPSASPFCSAACQNRFDEDNPEPDWDAMDAAQEADRERWEAWERTL